MATWYVRVVSCLASSDSSSDLNLSCHFSSFEQSGLESDESSSETIEPYQFEPLASHNEPSAGSFNTDKGSQDELRLNIDW